MSLEVVGLLAITFIERCEVGATDNEKPFDALQTGKTMRKYSGYWVSTVCYIWRTYEMRDAIANVESVVDDVSHLGSHMNGEPNTSHAGEGKPSYRLTARQTQAL